jgi:hypothetical protein
VATSSTITAQADRDSASPDAELPIACNQALIIGELVTEPETRSLPGGTELLSFSLTVRRQGAQTTSVPMVWYDPPKRVQSWKLGVHIVATGSVVRRFYRAGAVTASRTEVTVDHADLVTRRAAAKRIVSQANDRVAATLDAVEG